MPGSTGVALENETDYIAEMPSDASEAAVGATGAGEGRKRGPWFVVFIIALVVFIGSLVALGAILYSYFQGQQKYVEIAETSNFDPSTVDSEPLAQVTVDWDALRAVNPDTVGWVYVPNSRINYPIVQGQDNEHYLTYDFDGDQGWLAEYGSVFLDARNKGDWSDQLSFVYGHHMNDGSMFADIAGFVDQARFDECRTVYLLTPQGNYRLRSFSLVHCSAYDPIVETSFESAEVMTNYIQDKMDRSVVSVSDAPKASDIKKAFAFATCDNNSSGRYVLFCYIDDASAEGLSGVLGLSQDNEGQTEGFDNELSVIE